MSKIKWEEETVAERLAEAAETMKRLPSVKPKGYIGSWPTIIQEFWEAYGWNDMEVRLGPPSSYSIDRMDESLAWLRWLEPDEVRMVWLRAEDVPWKVIGKRFGCDRTTAWRRWKYAIIKIIARLMALEEKNAATGRCNIKKRSTSRKTC